MDQVKIHTVHLGVSSMIDHQGGPQMLWDKHKTGVLVAIGTALEEGKYTGMDGATIVYPASVVSMLADGLNGLPIGQDHPEEEGGTTPNVGMITARGKGNGRADIEFVVIDPHEAELVEQGKRMLSIEADVGAKWNPILNAWEAYSAIPRRVSLVDEGACPSCVIHTTRRAQLGQGDWMSFNQNPPPNQQPGMQPGQQQPQQLTPQQLQACIMALQQNGYQVQQPGQQTQGNPSQQQAFPGGVKMGNPDNPDEKEQKPDENPDTGSQVEEKPDTQTPPETPTEEIKTPETPEVPDQTELLATLSEQVKEMSAKLAKFEEKESSREEKEFKTRLSALEKEIKADMPAFDTEAHLKAVGCDGSPECAEASLKSYLMSLAEIKKNQKDVKLSVDENPITPETDITEKILGVSLSEHINTKYKDALETRGWKL